MLSVKKYLTLLPLLLSFLGFAGDWTSDFASNQLGNNLKTVHANEKNEVIYNYLQETKEGKFISSAAYFKFLSGIESELVEDSPFYLKVIFHVGKELQTYKKFHLAYPYLYKTALIVQDDPLAHDIPCDYFEVMGITYFFFDRYSKAEETFNKGLMCDGISEQSKINIYNTIGLIYSNLNNPDKAKDFFMEAMKVAQKIDHKAWFGVLSGNIGNIIYRQGEKEKAQEYIEIDYEMSIQHQQYGSAMNALSLLAIIEVDKGNYQKAKDFYRIHDSLQELYNNNSVSSQYFLSKTSFYEELGDYESALTSYKKYRELLDTIRQSKDVLTVQNTEFQINFEKKQAEYQRSVEEHKTDRIKIISLLVVISTVVIGAGLIIWQISKRRSKEKELMQLKNQQMEEDIHRLETEMNQVLNNLIVKNEKINELNEEIENVQSKTERKEEMKSLTDKLQSFTFLTDEDWVEFKRLFESRYKGFFDYFLENHPTVTNAEMRLAALIKLKLEKLEMSKALGISPESVSKTNLRLRKKLDIKDQKDLQNFILSI